MTSEREALDRIAALLPEPSPLGGVDMIDADRVRAILAEVSDEPDPRPADLQDALKRVVEKAVVYGVDGDGFIQGYIMGTGAIHNAIRVLQNQGIHVHPHGWGPQ